MTDMHGLRGWTSAGVQVEGLLLLIRVQDLVHVSASGKWRVENDFYNLLSETQTMDVCSVSISLTIKNRKLENLELTEQVQLTCVKRRSLFVESGGVVVLQLFLFCPPAFGQFCCFQTVLIKNMKI